MSKEQISSYQAWPCEYFVIDESSTRAETVNIFVLISLEFFRAKFALLLSHSRESVGH